MSAIDLTSSGGDPPLRSDPYALLRLSFESLEEFQAYARTHAKMLVQIWLWHQMLGDRESDFMLPGICDLCEHLTGFAAAPQREPEGARFAHRVAWRMIRCGCGLTGVERAVFRALLDYCRVQDRVYLVGYHSGFRSWLAARMPSLCASQYEEGRAPGEIADGIRYEDITKLSFGAEEFDCILCIEVLEHVPDYRAGLREMVRVLRPGGRALLTFPWLGGDSYDHLVRAEMMPDGSIRHHEPAEYHEDPAKPGNGILSFRSFGWRILDELRDAGFSRAAARFLFGPVHGHFTLSSPVIVGIR